MIEKKYPTEIADAISKKIGLNIRFYGKSFSLLTFGYATNILRGIASTYLVARWVSPEILGQFRYMITLFGVAGIFSLAGYGSSMVKGLARGETASVYYAIKKTLIFAPLGSILLLATAAERFIHGEPIVGWSIVVAAISFVPYTLSSFYTSIFTGLERIKDLTLANLWSNVGYAVTFTIVLLLSKNLIILTTAYFLIDIVIRGWISWRIIKQLPPQKHNESNHEKIANHLNGITVMTTISGSIAQILLQRIWGYSALASFSVAMILPEQLMNLAKTMNGTILQRLSRHTTDEKNLILVRRHFWNAFKGSILIIIGYVVIAPIIIPIFFPQYPEAVLPSIVYAICLIGIPSLIGIYYFQAHANYRSLWRYYASTVFIQAVTSIVFVPLIGQWGAILSRVAMRVGGLPSSYPKLPMQTSDTTSPKAP